MGQLAKLVLFDVEIHGHRSELHFHIGPATRRFVDSFYQCQNGLNDNQYFS